MLPLRACPSRKRYYWRLPSSFGKRRRRLPPVASLRRKRQRGRPGVTSSCPACLAAPTPPRPSCNPSLPPIRRRPSPHGFRRFSSGRRGRSYRGSSSRSSSPGIKQSRPSRACSTRLPRWQFPFQNRLRRLSPESPTSWKRSGSPRRPRCPFRRPSPRTAPHRPASRRIERRAILPPCFRSPSILSACVSFWLYLPAISSASCRKAALQARPR